MDHTTYAIPADLLQVVVNYMASRPWHEVAGAMPGLMDLKEVALPEPLPLRRRTKPSAATPDAALAQAPAVPAAE